MLVVVQGHYKSDRVYKDRLNMFRERMKIK